MKHIFEFCGKIGSGKTYVSDMLFDTIVNKHGVVPIKLHFAGKLKKLCMLVGVYKDRVDLDMMTYNNIKDLYNALNLDIDIHNFFDRFYLGANKIILSGVSNDVMGRKFLQFIGTDLVRYYKDSYWVEIVVDEILKDNHEFFIIDDYRFPNECLKFMKNYDNIDVKVYKVEVFDDVRMSRLGVDIDTLKEIDGHVSEYYVTNNMLYYDSIVDNNIEINYEELL